MPRLEGDLLEALAAAAAGDAADGAVREGADAAVTVVLAGPEYPARSDYAGAAIERHRRRRGRRRARLPRRHGDCATARSSRTAGASSRSRRSDRRCRRGARAGVRGSRRGELRRRALPARHRGRGDGRVSRVRLRACVPRVADMGAGRARRCTADGSGGDRQASVTAPQQTVLSVNGGRQRAVGAGRPQTASPDQSQALDAAGSVRRHERVGGRRGSRGGEDGCIVRASPEARMARATSATARSPALLARERQLDRSGRDDLDAVVSITATGRSPSRPPPTGRRARAAAPARARTRAAARKWRLAAV